MRPYYEHGGITIYHGDCLDVFPGLDADVLVTDPPYGIGYSSGYARELVNDGGLYENTNGSIRGDANTMARDMILAAWGDRPAVVFGSLRAPFPARWKQALVWDKGDAAGMGDLRIPWKPNHELVFVIGDWSRASDGRSSGVLSFPNISRLSMGRTHPHDKPIALMSHLLSKCPPGKVIDPFMGGGPTLVAAKNLGRVAIGIEIEERYCEIAARRLSQEVLPLGMTP